MSVDILKSLESLLGKLIYVSRLDHVIRFFSGNRIPILMYHSVIPDSSEDESCLFLAGMSLHVSRFEAQMECISRNYSTINLTDIYYWQSEGKKLPKNACVITFDDGLPDVYENAVPILRKLGLTATIFIIGNTLESPNSVWLHELYRILDSVPMPKLIIALSSETGAFGLSDGASKGQVRLWAQRYLKSTRVSKAEKIALVERLKRRFDSYLTTRPLFMDEQQILQLLREGYQIGAHSMSHLCLSDLDNSRLESEILDCRKVLTKAIGLNPETFCYPFGGYGSWDERVISILRENGYLCAVTTVEGLNSPRTDRFELKRIRITGNLSFSAFLFRLFGFRSVKWSLHTFVRRLKGASNNAKRKKPIY